MILCDPVIEIVDGISTADIPNLKMKGEEGHYEICFLFVMEKKRKRGAGCNESMLFVFQALNKASVTPLHSWMGERKYSERFMS